jgi:hypothetical protein
MTFEIALVLGILAISLILFISEVIRMDLGGRREVPMILVIMITGAVLSAFMNNIGVAALMLPVVVGVARRTRIPASRLLMPLAYSTLLGGLMTMIGTPPNLLISESLTRFGYEPFKLFDFTPLGGAVMAIGVLFVALFGRFLLPKQPAERGKHVSQRNLRSRYKLHERTFMMRVPTHSVLVGKTLAESRLGSSTGLIILALVRHGRSETLPSRQTVIRGGDGILVQGRVDQFRELRRWSDLVIEREAPVLKSMVAAKIGYAEVTLADTSPLVSELVRHAPFECCCRARSIPLHSLRNPVTSQMLKCSPKSAWPRSTRPTSACSSCAYPKRAILPAPLCARADWQRFSTFALSLSSAMVSSQ